MMDLFLDVKSIVYDFMTRLSGKGRDELWSLYLPNWLMLIEWVCSGSLIASLTGMQHLLPHHRIKTHTHIQIKKNKKRPNLENL